MPNFSIVKRETFPGHYKYILRVKVNGVWKRVDVQFCRWIDAIQAYDMIYGHLGLAARCEVQS